MTAAIRQQNALNVSEYSSSLRSMERITFVCSIFGRQVEAIQTAISTRREAYNRQEKKKKNISLLFFFFFVFFFAFSLFEIIFSNRRW